MFKPEINRAGQINYWSEYLNREDTAHNEHNLTTLIMNICVLQLYHVNLTEPVVSRFNTMLLFWCLVVPHLPKLWGHQVRVCWWPHTRFKTVGDRAFLAVKFSPTVFTLTPLILLKIHFYIEKLSTNLLFSCWILVFYIVIYYFYSLYCEALCDFYLWKRSINKFYLLYCHHVNVTV